MKFRTINIGFTYDVDGLRTSKTIPNVGLEHKYYYVGDRLQYETLGGSSALWYFYDADGNPSGIRYKDNSGTVNDYYFVCNWRGDVIQIYNASGTLVGSYTYDAWGRVTENATSADTENITETNPIRYRGYYYDTETRLYYLKSRYYDPAVKRFLNADNETDIGSKLLSTNLFQYSANNPVNNIDLNGHGIIKTLFKKAVRKVATFVHNQVVKVAQKSRNRVGTRSIGASASAYCGFGAGVSAGVTYDKRGNRGIFFTGSIYAGTPSASVGMTFSSTTAPTIMKQTKESYGFGGSMGPIGAEYQLFVDEIDIQKLYHSITMSGGCGAAPAEVHADYNYTMLWSYNIYDLEEKLYAKIME